MHSIPISRIIIGWRRYWGAAFLIFGAVLRCDSRSLWFSIGACGIAATVATFQFAVFTSFLAAGATAPRYIDADAWITDIGVECFDFPTPLPDGYRGALLAELPGAQIDRVVVGFTGWVSPSGARGNVALIGIDGSGLGPRVFRAERSDLERLQLTGAQAHVDASIGGVSVQLADTTDRLATFLGAPYVIMDFETARNILGYPADTVAFLAVRFAEGPPKDLDQRLQRISRRYPELGVHTGTAFAKSSSSYWQNKTGAGAAILLAAVLASMLMALLLINGVGRFVQRRQSDIISMLGHGASPAHIGTLLMAMAGFLIANSLAQALVFVPLVVRAAHGLLPWVTFKPIDAGFALAVSLACLVASLISAHHELERFPADAIFRS